MISVRSTALAISFFFATIDSVAAQESAESTAAENDTPPQTESGECFTSSALTNMTVFSDDSVYVRTLARHFLLVSRGQCDNLLRAYNRNAVQFVPFGRRICPNDGSHFLYESGGRARVCPIAAIYEVDDRAEARAMSEDLVGARDAELEIRELDTTDER